jgi:hypothetical protein
VPGEWNLAPCDADQWRIIIAGVLITRGEGQSGLADGEYFTSAWGDYWIHVEGSDGSVVRSASYGLRLEMTLTLLETSVSNQYLSTLHASDLNSPGLKGIGSLVVQDMAGETFIRCTRSWLKKPADITLERGVTARKWPINGIATVYNF